MHAFWFCKNSFMWSFDMSCCYPSHARCHSGFPRSIIIAIGSNQLPHSWKGCSCKVAQILALAEIFLLTTETYSMQIRLTREWFPFFQMRELQKVQLLLQDSLHSIAHTDKSTTWTHTLHLNTQITCPSQKLNELLFQFMRSMQRVSRPWK